MEIVAWPQVPGLAVFLKCLDLLLGFLFADAISFLNLSCQIDALARNHIKMVISQLAPATQISFALPANAAQADLSTLYSAVILSLPALYSFFEMPAAIGPALKARPSARASALILKWFITIPF